MESLFSIHPKVNSRQTPTSSAFGPVIGIDTGDGDVFDALPVAVDLSAFSLSLGEYFWRKIRIPYWYVAIRFPYHQQNPKKSNSWHLAPHSKDVTIIGQTKNAADQAVDQWETTYKIPPDRIEYSLNRCFLYCLKKKMHLRTGYRIHQESRYEAREISNHPAYKFTKNNIDAVGGNYPVVRSVVPFGD